MQGKTLRDLFDEWLRLYPTDLCHPHLGQRVRAGYVETREGLFYWFSEYRSATRRTAP